jgi:transposase
VGRKAIYSPEDKLQIVLSVLRGETTQTEISRRLQMSQTTIAKWQRLCPVGGAAARPRGARPRRPESRREQELEAKVEDLTSALGEAYVELRVWRKGGALYPHTKRSRP